MKKFTIILCFAAFLSGCNRVNNQEEEPVSRSGSATKLQDTTPRVTGVGGIFFSSKNRQEMQEWYEKNLGLAINEDGVSPFEFRNANRPDETNYLIWSLYEGDSEHLVPSKNEFMINYRVQNLDGLVKKLKENGVTIVDEIETFRFGKFVHILDPDGNKIELWEPVDSVLTRLGGKTVK